MDKKVIISLIMVIGWMGLIFFFSSMNTDTSNNNSSFVVNGVIKTIDKVTNADSNTLKKHNKRTFLNDVNTIFRKVCHALSYLVLAILVLNYVVRVINNKVCLYYAISFIVCIIYASLDEYHQTFVNGRTGQFSDVVIDCLGVILGCIIFSLINKKRLKNE